MFNASDYFKNCNSKLKLCVDNKYKFSRVTGLEYLEDILSDLKQPAYLAVDDTDDGVTVREGAGYFVKRVITVFILRRYKLSDQVDRETKLAETRLIRNKLTAKLIKDSNAMEELMYLDKIRSHSVQHLTSFHLVLSQLMNRASVKCLPVILIIWYSPNMYIRLRKP